MYSNKTISLEHNLDFESIILSIIGQGLAGELTRDTSQVN